MSQNGRRFAGQIERLRAEERVARLEVPRVIQHSLDAVTVESVLDIGTGSGIFAEAFAAKVLSAKGIDIREDMLEAAREFVPTGEFKLGKMEAIPYPDQSFDLAFMGLVLHEADDLKVALSEAHRVVTERVVVLEWVYGEQDFGPPLDHRLQPQVVVDRAKAAGFKTVEQIDLTHLVLYRLDK